MRHRHLEEVEQERLWEMEIDGTIAREEKMMYKRQWGKNSKASLEKIKRKS